GCRSSFVGRQQALRPNRLRRTGRRRSAAPGGGGPRAARADSIVFAVRCRLSVVRRLLRLATDYGQPTLFGSRSGTLLVVLGSRLVVGRWSVAGDRAAASPPARRPAPAGRATP